MTKVDIGKKVEFEELITAFSKAADKLGWKTEVNDQFEKSYKLGSVKEIEKYSCTKVTLNKRFFGNVMNFNVYKNERPLGNTPISTLKKGNKRIPSPPFFYLKQSLHTTFR